MTFFLMSMKCNLLAVGLKPERLVCCLPGMNRGIMQQLDCGSDYAAAIAGANHTAPRLPMGVDVLGTVSQGFSGCTDMSKRQVKGDGKQQMFSSHEIFVS